MEWQWTRLGDWEGQGLREAISWLVVGNIRTWMLIYWQIKGGLWLGHNLNMILIFI